MGLYTDYSYARSLARFSATLGPNVWKVASRRIEQALPPGFKYGRGWVGDYEELSTPVLMPENYTLKEPAFLAKFKHRTGAEKDKFVSENPASSKENPVKGPKTEGQSPYFGSSGTKPTADNSPNISINANELPVSDANIGSNAFVPGTSGNKPSSSASPKYHLQNSQPQNFIKSEKRFVKHVELNSVPQANERNVNLPSQSQVTKSIAVPGSRSFEMVPMNTNMLSSGSYKQLNINGVSAAVPDGKSPNNGFDSNRTVRQPNDFVNSMDKAATLFENGQGQGLSDPMQRMRMLSEKTPNQQKSSQQARVDVPLVSPSTVSLPKDGPNNAASAAARVWMSIGEASYKQAGENMNSQNNQISAGSSHNPSRDFQSQFRGELPAYPMYFQPGKGNFPFHAFVPHPARVGTEGQLPYEPMVFPQSVPADLSRFQVQSSRPNLNAPAPPRQKRESVPPDLNVSFQSSGSPGRTSGVLVDSQQPDLALQL